MRADSAGQLSEMKNPNLVVAGSNPAALTNLIGINNKQLMA